MWGELGILMVRAPAGVLLAGHGAQKLFGWFGGPGIDRQGELFEHLGYPWGRSMAVVAGLTEIGAGAGIAAGLMTPLAAAGVIGVMANAAVSAHGEAGLWAQNGGYEYPLVLATVAAGLATHGPGAWSVDAVFGFGRTGFVWGLGAVGLGLAAAAGTLGTRRQHRATRGSEYGS